MLPRLGSGSWRAISALSEGFYYRVGEIPAEIPATKVRGPMTISNSLVLGLEDGAAADPGSVASAASLVADWMNCLRFIIV